MTKTYRIYLKSDYMGIGILAASFETSERSNQLWFRGRNDSITAIFALDHVDRVQDGAQVVWPAMPETGELVSALAQSLKNKSAQR